MTIDWDTLRTLADIGLGAVALYYARNLGKVIENHETRLVALEKRA